MKNVKRRRSLKTGLPPGTLIHVGDRKQETVEIGFFSYNQHVLEEKKLMTLDQIKKSKDDRDTIEWINISALHDVGLISSIGEIYGLHPLLLEDVLSTLQPSKIDEYDNCLFIVVQMPFFNESDCRIYAEQVSFVLMEDTVISFEERSSEAFNFIRERIRHGKGRVRRMGADYLLYALLDTVVDSYFNMLEKVEDKIEKIENGLVAGKLSNAMKELHHLKREMISVRKAIGPLREMVSNLVRGEFPYITRETSVFFKDLYDHVVQIIYSAENHRDVLSGLMELYHSEVAHRMNQVIKVLTIISTIFMPLTFIAGIYGMNFRYMPELGWKTGYPLSLTLMAIVAIVMLLFFKRKGWLTSNPDKER